MLTGMANGPRALVVIGSGVLGLGVGASVSPALFMAGFSMRSAQIQRVFALVELLRGMAAFMIAPLLLRLATTVASGYDARHAGTSAWSAGGGDDPL